MTKWIISKHRTVLRRHPLVHNHWTKAPLVIIYEHNLPNPSNDFLNNCASMRSHRHIAAVSIWLALIWLAYAFNTDSNQPAHHSAHQWLNAYCLIPWYLVNGIIIEIIQWFRLIGSNSIQTNHPSLKSSIYWIIRKERERERKSSMWGWREKWETISDVTTSAAVDVASTQTTPIHLDPLA